VSEKQMQRLGDLLLSANLIDEIQLRVALQEQSDTGERLGSCLVHLGFIDEAVLAAFLSRQADLPCVNIQGLHIPDKILSAIPKELAFEKAIIPVRRSGDVLYLAMADPFDEVAKQKAAQVTGLTIVPMIAPEFRLKKSLERFYEGRKEVEEPERVSVELSQIVEEMEAESIQVLTDKVDALAVRIDKLTTTVENLRRAIVKKRKSSQSQSQPPPR
jgi:type IV pilus assembly protein PilB